MVPEKSGTRVLNFSRRHDGEDYFALLAVVLRLYLILVLYEKRVVRNESLGSLFEAEAKAVSLASEWYRKDGITSFGKYQLETFDEMQEYHHSDAYFDSGDGVHIVIESLGVAA